MQMEFFCKNRVGIDLFSNCDISARIASHLTDNPPSKVIANSIYINHSNEVILLLKEWVEREKESEIEQMAFRDVILSNQTAKIYPMPIAYSAMLDFDDYFIRPEDIVIKHY